MHEWVVTMKNIKRIAILLCLQTVFVAMSVIAAEPDWPQEKIAIHAQEKQLDEFLQDFFAAIDMKVLVSSSVQGRISGKFDDAPEKIFDDIVKAYGLLPYFDGAVFHISNVSNVQSRAFELTPKQLNDVLKSLITQGLSDRYQSVHVLRAENRIKVRGAPEFMTDVEEIVQGVLTRRSNKATVRQLPAALPTSNQLEFRTFALQYASAADVTLVQGGREFRIPGVASLLRSIVGDGQSPVITSMRFGPTGPMPVPGLREHNVVRQPISNNDTESGQAIDTTQVTAGGVVTDRPFVARIEPERNLNAVIVRDYADTMPVYEQLILQLDQEPLLVEIQVTIIDIDKSQFNDLGVDWEYSDNQTEARFGGGEVVGQNGGLLLNTVLGDSGNFLARVNALEVTGSADVVSRPQVLTLSNLEAVLASDQSFFVRVAGNEDVDLFNVTVGTTLRVVPSIVGSKDDPQIRLLVSIEDGSLTPEAVDEIPIIDKSTLSTQAIIYDGESLLLGGLVRESTETNETGVPVLGSVPVVGRLFKRKTDVKSSTERLFLITPNLIHGTRDIGRSTGPASRASRRDRRGRQAQYDVQSGEPQAYLDGF